LTISRDLHDNIGAQLTFIISSVDNIKYAFDLQNTKLDDKLQKISNFTKDTIVELRDTIWAMNNNAISFEDLRSRILNFIEKAKVAKENINFKFNIDEKLNKVELTSIVGMNIYRTIQEAVNNAIKYANPTEIEMNATKTDKFSI
ncbi:MAG: histidine kinase, partial [Ignavibacteria bacterium]|nr:histidine kinase [Ignavibacteria bacterium]